MIRSYLRNYLFLILAGFLALGCKQAASVPLFDSQIGSLTLVKLFEGEEAIKEINKLHGKSIKVVRGFVAHYEGDHQKAAVWVSEAESEALAKDQVEMMIDKMKSNTRAPFRNYRTLEKQGCQVMAFDGMRQVHYVFREGPWVYWISADDKSIETVFEHLKTPQQAAGNLRP
jgi:hypothetical protein